MMAESCEVAEVPCMTLSGLERATEPVQCAFSPKKVIVKHPTSLFGFDFCICH